jgi:2-methylisocitrate lyase-like PEP mutase family enzyme
MSFRDMHVKGQPFVLANAWDIGSAKILVAMGAKAIGTSSAAHAFTLGRPDGGTVTRDEALAHAQELIAAVDVPVSGDFENGFGDSPEACAETVRLSAEVGLAGICIEDTAFPSGEPYEFELAVERMRAAADAAKSVKGDFFFVARADGLMIQKYGVDDAISRLQAFEAVGVDGLYAPLPPSMEDLARIVSSVSAPVNALAAGPYSKVSMAEFAAAGVARVSLGSALARVTHRVIHDAAKAMFEAGDFSALSTAIGGDATDNLLKSGSRDV